MKAILVHASYNKAAREAYAALGQLPGVTCYDVSTPEGVMEVNALGVSDLPFIVIQRDDESTILHAEGEQFNLAEVQAILDGGQAFALNIPRKAYHPPCVVEATVCHVDAAHSGSVDFTVNGVAPQQYDETGALVALPAPAYVNGTAVVDFTLTAPGSYTVVADGLEKTVVVTVPPVQEPATPPAPVADVRGFLLSLPSILSDEKLMAINDSKEGALLVQGLELGDLDPQRTQTRYEALKASTSIAPATSDDITLMGQQAVSFGLPITP